MLPPGAGGLVGCTKRFPRTVAADEEERHLGHGKTDLQAATTASEKGCEAEVEKANLVIIKLNNKTKTKMPTQSEEFVFPGSLVR